MADKKRPKKSTQKQLNHRHMIHGMIVLAVIMAGMIGFVVSTLSHAASPTVTGQIKGIGDKCLDNRHAKSANRNKIQMFDCNNTIAQHWSIFSDGSLRVQGKCLHVRGGSTKPRAIVQLYKCKNSQAQKWTIKTDGTIRNSSSGMCLDVRWGNTQNNAVVWTYACNGTSAQKWITPQIAATPVAPQPPTTPQPSPAPVTSRWQPRVGETWQYQLTGTVDLTKTAQVYNIDGFDTPVSKVAEIHRKGARAICYVNGGAWEDWRSDANKFPVNVKGKNLDGWPGEKWLDTRNITALAPIMNARLDLCVQKGFDAVEFDNVDGHIQDSGFAINYSHQLAYNKWLAKAAHSKGLAVGLKNNLDQVRDLVTHYDFAVNEECYQYDECNMLTPFINAGKPVFHVEYQPSTAQFCPTTKRLGFSSIRKSLDLPATLTRC